MKSLLIRNSIGILGLILLAPCLFAFEGTLDCKLFPDKGCLYIPSNWQGNNNNKILLYVRGHHEGSGYVPPEQREIRSREALTGQGLIKMSEELSLPVFATGSSQISFLPDDIHKLEGRLGRPLQLELAAHSGGYVGLFDTLRSIEREPYRVIRIIFLDSYYSGNAVDLNTLKEYQGFPCLGFHTDHNHRRYLSLYKSLGCLSDGPVGYTHSGSIATCLPRYLSGSNSCK